MRSQPIAWVLLSLGWALFGSAAPSFAAGAWVKRAEAEIGLGNDSIELWFKTDGPRCAAARLVNRLSGRTIALRSDDFAVGLDGRPPLRLADVPFQEAREEAIAGGRRLVLRHAGPAQGPRVDVVYELGDGDFFLRRRLEIAPAGPMPLRELAVWVVGIEGQCSHQGFGSPVLLDDTFWGVEFPAGHNRYESGTVRLIHHPGRTVTERFASKTVVLGVSEAGRSARRFQQYVETFRVTPRETSLFVNYNTWWTLMPPTEKNSLELIALFKKKLFDAHGESIDTFTLDDGWDNKDSLWAIREDRFPRGFAPLVESLKTMNARLGIWLSPSSGYSHAPWLAKNGYAANSNPWYICQSDPKYRRDIIARVTDLARQYDVAFFKFDGFSAACDAAGHAHLPGPYAQEANTEAYIDLLEAVRKVRPGIYLDPTCGIWLSPWWLRYADSLWGEVSDDYPEIVVPAPVVRDSATTTRDAMFRQRCRQHPGFPPAAIEHLGIIVITPEKWEDNAMIVAGRGCRLLTLYIDPRHFIAGDRDWAFLASVLKWVRHNADTLQQTELILGDPMRGQAYGYAHFRGHRGVLALRNPGIEPQTVKIALDESAGWRETDGTYLARIVYPRRETLDRPFGYGDTLALRLEAFETMIVHLDRLPQREPAVLGVRHEETSRSDNRITYTLYGAPGEQAKVSVLGQAPKAVEIDGRPVAPSTSPGGIVLPVTFPGQSQACKIEAGQLAVEASGDSWRIVGRCVADVPAGVPAAMHVLVDPQRKPGDPVQCVAKLNGRPVDVRAVRTPAKPEQTHRPHPWTWFEFRVPPGRSEVSVEITPSKPSPFLRSRVGWWLWAERPMQKATLTLQYAQRLPPAVAEPLPLPLAMDRRREIVAIQPIQSLGAGSRWPKQDQAVVYLDEIAPDEATQDWGTLQTNRSVWEKPMIVAGAKFARGLGAHANARLVYDLAGGRFKTFRCRVGRDEHAQDGVVAFQVLVDGKKVFDSGPMTKATPARPVEVNVAGAQTLELLSLDGGDGITGDHADWAEAQLIR
ncbi:MAG: NPCBM/NEW2 domain-containing protein [Thermoguttaceae bacterium]|nr:NPCBM/NEW2 domain-containing protein [Thermoguttaceae bacterium]